MRKRMIHSVQAAKLIERIVQATGKNEAQIARLAKTTQPTINRIRSGAIKDPRSSLTERLRRLYEREVAPVRAPGCERASHRAR
jgi:predicted transcriptional regulator